MAESEFHKLCENKNPAPLLKFLATSKSKELQDALDKDGPYFSPIKKAAQYGHPRHLKALLENATVIDWLLTGTSLRGEEEGASTEPNTDVIANALLSTFYHENTTKGHYECAKLILDKPDFVEAITSLEENQHFYSQYFQRSAGIKPGTFTAWHNKSILHLINTEGTVDAVIANSPKAFGETLVTAAKNGHELLATTLLSSPKILRAIAAHDIKDFNWAFKAAVKKHSEAIQKLILTACYKDREVWDDLKSKSSHFTDDFKTALNALELGVTLAAIEVGKGEKPAAKAPKK